MEEMTFEAAMKRLEEIAALLESGRQPLEEAMALFEEGVKLTGYCTKKLEQAQQKILKLTSQAEKGENE